MSNESSGNPAVDEAMNPLVDSAPLQGDEAALRGRMDRDGYLYIRGLVKDDVGPVYELISGICREHGWLDEAGRAQGEPRLEGRPEFWEVYDEVQASEAFHALAHNPAITQVIAALVQEPVLAHPRNIARISYPKAGFFTTPSHQDYVHIQGTPETYTVWIPLTDCPQELGGLAMLAGSHKLGILPVHKADGAGGLGIDTSELGLTWYASDLQAGDALIFHSHTVHKALPNVTDNRIRFSVDYRYQGVSQPIVADGLLPHYNRLGWDKIYEGWSRQDLQYYWRDLNLKTVQRDPSYHANAPERKKD